MAPSSGTEPILDCDSTQYYSMLSSSTNHIPTHERQIHVCSLNLSLHSRTLRRLVRPSLYKQGQPSNTANLNHIVRGNSPIPVLRERSLRLRAQQTARVHITNNIIYCLRTHSYIFVLNVSTTKFRVFIKRCSEIPLKFIKTHIY